MTFEKLNFLLKSGKIFEKIIFVGKLGLFFLGSLFAAIGLFTSSITKNQVMAYVLAVFFCFIIFYGFESLASYNLLGSMDFYVQKIGSFTHYNQFLKGIIDTRDLLYFLILIGILNQISIVNLENKK